MVGFGQHPKFGDAQHNEERNHRQERDQQLGFDARGHPCDEPDNLAAQRRDDTGGRASIPIWTHSGQARENGHPRCGWTPVCWW